MRLFFMVVPAIAAVALFAAGNAEAADKPPARSVVGMANPASVHCVKIGGRLEIRKDKAGNQTGYCHLRNGRICEEWALFRDEKCVRPRR